MAFIKRFKCEVINNPTDQTVIENWGTLDMHILLASSTYNSGYKNPSEVGIEPWVGHVDQPGLVGCCAFTTALLPADYHQQLFEIAPATLLKDPMRFANKYIKLTDVKSGFYAISHTAIDGSTGLYVDQEPNNTWGYDLYKNDGTPMLNYLKGYPIAVPLFGHTGNKHLNLCCQEKDGRIKTRSEGGTFFNTAFTWADPRFVTYNVEVISNLSNTEIDTYVEWLNNLSNVDVDDPYPGIPDSLPSGPSEGVGIPSSDPVDFPDLPQFSIVDTGFVSIFNPTLAQVKSLADYMWNGLFDMNNFRKIFADPMDCILGFNMVPVSIPSSAAVNIAVGNVPTTIAMNPATSQWVELDCGSLDIGLPYGSYLDFSPYTKFSIYLPYIGTCDLSADDVAGKVLSLKYHIDVLSCSCVAYLKCGDHVLYQWTGACGYSIPVTQNDFSRMIMSIIAIAGGAIGGAITSGGGASVMAASALKGGAESAAKNVMGLKPDIHRSGSIGSGAGLMGGQTPYLIIEVPQACKPEKQYHYTGYPGFITVTVGDLSGYAEFNEIILDGIACTEAERGMIDSLCKGGIYL